MRTARLAVSAVAAVITITGAAATPAVFADDNTPQSGPSPIVAAVTVASAAAAAVDNNVATGSVVAAATSTPDSQPTIKPCNDRLVRIIRRAGFTGENVREAWAIAMRESNGQPRLGPGHPQFNGSDYGLFQWNQGSWGDERWFDTKKLLNGIYNARIAYRMSDGGNDWVHWGLTGDGETDITSYAGIWSPTQIYNWITEPYQRYIAQFDQLPKPCRKN